MTEDMGSGGHPTGETTVIIPLAELEKRAIENAIRVTGSIAKAAQALGIGRATIYRKLIEYSIKL